MTKIKVFEYDDENVSGHLTLAESELQKIGAENVSYMKNGKPVADNLFVSISHSGGICAVCVSENPVGIDIEKIVERNFERIVCKMFSDEEKAYFDENNRSPDAFYEIWTRKEAYSKISGDGLKQIIGGADTFSLRGFDFKTEITEDYVLTVCEKSKLKN